MGEEKDYYGIVSKQADFLDAGDTILLEGSSFVNPAVVSTAVIDLTNGTVDVTATLENESTEVTITFDRDENVLVRKP